MMYEFYNDLDEIVISNALDKIAMIEEKFEEVLNHKETAKLVDKEQIAQLTLLIEGIKKFYNKDYKDALSLFLKAISISNEAFTPDNYKEHKYNLLESRIMLLIAMSYSGLNDTRRSTDMMLLIMKQLNNSHFLTENHIKLIIKLYMNLSYNYYTINDLNKSFYYANKGIKFAKEHNSSYILFALYYRRAVAKLMMGRKNYKDDFRFSITLLEIEGKKDLIKIYRSSTLKIHKIEI